MRRPLALFALAVAAVAGAVWIAFARRPQVLFADETAPGLLVDAPATMVALEAAGYSFGKVVGPTVQKRLATFLDAEIDELKAGRGPGGTVKRAFKAEWVERGKLELVGLVNRTDRTLLEPEQCGETRLIYRLALKNEGRPVTRLPLTVNVRIPQPRHGADCRDWAERWQIARDAFAILRALPAPTKIELNYQSLHAPSFKSDMDDNAEYVLHTFRLEAGALVPEPLVGTPRGDLSPEERRELEALLVKERRAIEEGTFLLPTKFAATRAISVSPRGHVHAKNRPYTELFDAAARRRIAESGATPGSRLTTPEVFFRRLDEASCPGCHQSRGIAGFHLLGEERDSGRTANALAVGHSPHLAGELAWRRDTLAALARGQAPTPRPFAVRSAEGGAFGAACSVKRAGAGPTDAYPGWTCAAGLACRDLHGEGLGVCAPPAGRAPGDPCEPVTVSAASRPEGAVVTSRGGDATCPVPTSPDVAGPFCAPNWLGFTGGMCSVRCARVGDVEGSSICAPLPSAGYESECFSTDAPVETCLERYYVNARIATCDRAHPCRDDFACARVPGAPAAKGACLPPYFVFQLRLDGPVRDR